eukprot:CAMPEP_0202457262 /NCGR_PEP_ID=MMETSP1360-20130828/14319_1 /ASSEMBLY_ACC=CAM_ASM_000848 /TAXON_ID=515479 /ORGANISM="Licmophora paradoxa, Strain CCMP2313" /LENGTH=393 /DNA_ID=CAMNT_0049077287 /DNA_START=147 /DNA_END=1328 /DNA_ORIENTATION=-
MAKLNFFLRQNSKMVLIVSAALAFVSIVSLDLIQGGSSGGLRFSRSFIHFGGAAHKGYFTTDASVVNDHTFRFAAVTDLDQLSRIDSSSKPKFKSILLPGTITKDVTTNKYSIKFDDKRELTSSHNEAGRGMELSELTLFNNRLLAFDDRTGSVFEILNEKDGKQSFVVPRFVITEGEGDTDKGMKWEWATVKNGDLYMGSMGKEYTNKDGSVANTNNLWVSILTPRGELRRINWLDKFQYVRTALNASPSGYCIHEAILWSDHLNKWVFIPRRISSEPYDENKDERMGSNKILLVDEHFTSHKIVDIKMKELDPLHGFSSIAFIPGSQDKHILAIRTVEEDCVGGEETCKQRSYFLVFDVLTGEVLLDETKYPDDLKFEGVEFVDIYTPPTP